jgi:uncharacterized protein YrrD
LIDAGAVSILTNQERNELMPKGVDVIGKPVITHETGEQVGKIEDLIVDYNNNQVLGFLVYRGGWAGGARVLPWSAGVTVGPAGVETWSEQQIVEARQDYQITMVLEHDAIIGMKVMTTDGHALGTLVDIVFDAQSGSIRSYEITGSLLAGENSGYSFVPAPVPLKIEGHVILVPPSTADRAGNEPDDGLGHDAAEGA